MVKLIKDDLKEMSIIVKLNIEAIFSNKKFNVLVAFFMLLNFVPALLVHAISATGDIYVIVKSMYEILGVWQVTLTSSIFSIMLPLYASNILIGEQIRKKTLFNIVSRPVRRETVAITMIISALIVITLIGFFIGSIQYISLYITTRINKIIAPIPPELIYQTALLLLFVTPFYYTLSDLIIVSTKEFGLKAMIIYFFITLLLDLIFIALGGSYVFFAITHYRNSILYSTATNNLYRKSLMDAMFSEPSDPLISTIALSVPTLVLIILYCWKFSRSDLG